MTKDEKGLQVPEVATLQRVHIWLLKRVFVIKAGNTYRLMVYSSKELIYDRTYDSCKGAKIAFLKAWNYKRDANTEKLKVLWTPLKPVDESWLKKLGLCEYIRDNDEKEPDQLPANVAPSYNRLFTKQANGSDA
ncbi:MAG: hypothetical protein GY765_16290 [bacterium]|nr:hypothetical protein [bacterium]